MAREVMHKAAPATATTMWQDDMDRMLRQFFGDADASLAGAFSPALDVKETDDAFTLHIELPGVKAEDVELSLEDNVLTVAGERSFYDESEGEGYRRIERRFGRFHRAVRLPDRVSPDKVEATYADGILTVTVPKAEDAKPRKITVAKAS
ncbi:Hsp20/alpha crystallin family protein [Demequina salsinemoris]|uniref:Hsp20/alpha crystallin family protein n=1 Tax=Demequina salsinemoris TaxID=577470 RepID=UPI0009FDB442|nr:Hsp20/alpha crystallin family protein [Demequina salsinemoris]